MTIDEGRKTNGGNRFTQSILKKTEFIHSTFDVGSSMFDVQQIWFRSDRLPFSRRLPLVCNIARNVNVLLFPGHPPGAGFTDASADAGRIFLLSFGNPLH